MATLFADGERSEIGVLEAQDADSDKDVWKEAAASIETLRTLVGAHPGTDPRISFDDVRIAGAWLKRFHQFFAAQTMRIDHEPNVDDDPTHAIIYWIRCDVGEWCFFAIVRREVPLYVCDRPFSGHDVRKLLRKYREMVELLKSVVFGQIEAGSHIGATRKQTQACSTQATYSMPCLQGRASALSAAPRLS